ncbi:MULTISPECIES: helix-turn-helix domain-containing protein [unclassified Rhodococcus (in: high G+C Gram-positive bacteria)]|uniref:helix-turn-helix domain-containing protein n=1 Tax=unclassified Rhodococcus (in: high G+C Gram-positive bacteria) TaxID=192944 RepID=UPI0009EB9AE8|nr:MULTISPECIES: helix-turn-helix domain-containing protein [unclassified Rhodococcus (in: high G+C Gram-positive bacteria)]
MPSIEHLLTVAQVASRLGITRRAVQQAIARNALAAQKLPTKTGAYLIEPDEVDRYDQARRHETAVS